MTFEPIRNGRGQPTVRCTCDKCGRREVVAGCHGKQGNAGQAQAVRGVGKLGWTYIGKRLRCLSCSAKKKVDKMNDNTVPVAATAPLRDPTRAQKREIMDLLDDVYDTDNECYQRGDTDDTIAELLNVMPGWVAELREGFFGPSGGNQDMAALKGELQAFIAAAQEVKTRSERKLDALGGEIAKAKGFIDRLEAIQRAVGPRVLQRVK